ncbi:metal ABC transporter ATP-binding protein [Methanocella arvoryzae]|uniref:ABC-type transport system, ATPase component n=1 Tax=Methanocella arvoryzae (strain DSM 22066 / NBRC 105507 / MRE50) TaxID=351160 RepID=Q0W5K6_METAR|nr:metal ABC transporter ATP-binding protein [Methanocella arvoryzae]CAJ36337.1 ABC-type transport system, ATPase component [Methanocella arvoryzae MRE50]
MIELDGIYTAYEGGDRPVIRDLSLRIGKGEFVIIGGPNGAGKTTLLESINGMVRVTHGSARVCGIDVRRAGCEVRKRVGYVIQNFSFDPFTPFTVEQAVMMGRYGRLGMLRRPGKADFDAAERAIRLVGIEDLTHKPIGTLSGGQQQKTLIAQNLAKEPDVLLLDEPFSNLDFQAREFVSGILSGLVEKGTPVVIVSHAFDDLPDRDIRMIIMEDGQVKGDITCAPAEVKDVVRFSIGRSAVAVN